MNFKHSYTIRKKVRSPLILVFESPVEQYDELCPKSEKVYPFDQRLAV